MGLNHQMESQRQTRQTMRSKSLTPSCLNRERLISLQNCIVFTPSHYILFRNKKRKERFTAPVDPEMAEILAKRAKRFESATTA